MIDTDGAQPETSLRQRLKRETGEAHGRVEAQLGLLDPHLELERYRAVLETLYGFYEPVETGLWRVARACPPLGFALRARSALLESDLLALGLPAARLRELPRCVDVPRSSCIEDLAGCLYVLEGACLGGQILVPRLRARLGVAKEDGASFFAGDGEQTPARWATVLVWLEGLPHAGASVETIVAAARATFTALSTWVERREPSQPMGDEGRGRPQ